MSSKNPNNPNNINNRIKSVVSKYKTVTIDPITNKPFQSSIKRILVTPEMAENWLVNRAKNRNVNKNSVERYRYDMVNGHWNTDACDFLRFDIHGRLADGQHRTLALVLSKKSIVMNIMENCDELVMESVDKGRHRTLANKFQMNGEKFGPKHALAYRGIQEYMRSLRTMSSTQEFEYCTLLDEKWNRFEALYYGTKDKTKNKLLSAGMDSVHFILGILEGGNSTRVKKFVNDVIVGGTPVNSNEFKLREELLGRTGTSGSYRKNNITLALWVYGKTKRGETFTRFGNGKVKKRQMEKLIGKELVPMLSKSRANYDKLVKKMAA